MITEKLVSVDNNIPH